jgi:hypothetical protein
MRREGRTDGGVHPTTPWNLSVLSDGETARTDPEVAARRAETLAVLGVKSVLELCVGPSLRVLEEAYREQGISCVGNDVDRRWQQYYPQGVWRIGNALEIPWSGDAVVFAPPVSKGCTGRRVDSLRVCDVRPGYVDFIRTLRKNTVATFGPRVAVMVLPARCLANRFEREEFYHLLYQVQGLGRVEVIEQLCGRRKIRKYVELYTEVGG